jgi:murein DD-endopeptidase MepM/ murein hydrolase activator NlpD
MEKKRSAYTVFILPDPTAKPYSFSIKRTTCHYLISFLLVGLVVVFGFFMQSLTVMRDVSEISTLREENKVQRARLQSVVKSVTDMKQKMSRLIELDEKLRVMTDLAPRRGGVNILAQGGTEVPLNNPQEIEKIDLSPGWEKKIHPQTVFHSLRGELKRLSEQVVEEEQSFKELINTIMEIESRWGGTPSIWPVKGWVTSSFGPRISPFTGRRAMHNGLDIAARRGTKVISSADGEVYKAGFDNELGRGIFIRHGHGKTTIYGHLDRQVVSIGQEVKRGEMIGYVGSTGKSTGPHLHYEIRVNNIPVDPTRYILN